MSNLAYETDHEAFTANAPDPNLQSLRPIPRISIQALCDTESVSNPIERAGEDRRIGTIASREQQAVAS